MVTRQDTARRDVTDFACRVCGRSVTVERDDDGHDVIWDVDRFTAQHAACLGASTVSAWQVPTEGVRPARLGPLV